MDTVFSSATSPTPDKIIAGELPAISTEITVITGQNLVRGAVVGRVVGTITPAAVAGNTGTGTIASATAAAGVQEGVYRLVCIEPATDAGKFALHDPNGVFVGTVTVAVAFSNQLAFTITDATDFIAGDAFTITVAVGTKYKLAATAATDGSHIPRGILVESIDATAADKLASMYRTGEFNQAALTYGTGHTADTVRPILAELGMFLRSIIAN
jgi:hypothetical protein